ncbi:uncharacterized protein DS421_7g220630 [Arachis hypogaea]|nr:uncharacterized protein LOC112703461 [Arachis hypogaea]QHO28895.1 uncharacterized protein DS421_7g220630 [Arachis hypogaea]
MPRHLIRFNLLYEECIEFNKLGLRDNVAQIYVLERFHFWKQKKPLISNCGAICNSLQKIKTDKYIQRQPKVLEESIGSIDSESQGLQERILGFIWFRECDASGCATLIARSITMTSYT